MSTTSFAFDRARPLLRRAAPSPARGRRGWRDVAAALLIGGAAWATTASPSAHAFVLGDLWRRAEAPSGDAVALEKLPVEAQRTYGRILAGGPFPYDKDGTVFGNRERLLPRQARGFYREYTVKTRGADNRGARRIVCGGVPPTQPEACWYTADHYQTFQRIVASSAATAVEPGAPAGHATERQTAR